MVEFFGNFAKPCMDLNSPHACGSSALQVLPASLGFERLKSDSNLYFQPEQRCYMLCYVDDLLIFGDFLSAIRATLTLVLVLR